MDLAAGTALASGVGIALVGGALGVAPRLTRGARFFAVFCILWGCQIVILNIDRLLNLPSTFLPRVGVALVLGQVLFLTHFAMSFHERRTSGASSSFSVLVGIALLFAAVGLAIAPDAFVRLEAQSDGSPIVVYPILGTTTSVIPFFGAFYLATLLLAIRYERARDPLTRRELALVLGAIATYSSYSAIYTLLARLTSIESRVAIDGYLVVSLQIAIFFSGVCTVLYLAFRLARRLRRGTHPEQRQADVGILAALTLPALVGVVGALGFSDTNLLVGPIRFVSVAVLAYGLVKHHIFGIDLALKRTLRTTAPVLAFVFLSLVAGAFVREITPTAEIAGIPLFFMAGLAVGGTGAAIAVPLRAQVADAAFPGVTDSTGYRRARSLEVYQAALAQAVARGAEDDPLLPTLRARLGLTATDHEVLLYVVRADVKPEGGAVAASPPAPAGAGARYKREKLLAEGAFANVWLADDTTLQRKVVLKEFLRAGDPTPYDEARVASGLSHPNIVTVYDVVPEGERASLVLEYVPGGSLQARLDKTGKLPEAEALRITRDILRGLAALHKRGLVHQDIKPGNVLLADDGTAKVTDFGISDKAATARDTAAAAGATLGAGAGPGTLHYMSPEQAEGTPTDPRADLYATAALLYRCLAGRFYADFGNAGEYRVRRMILEEPPRLPLDGASTHVNTFLARCLAKRPDARYASADEALAALG